MRGPDESRFDGRQQDFQKMIMRRRYAVFAPETASQARGAGHHFRESRQDVSLAEVWAGTMGSSRGRWSLRQLAIAAVECVRSISGVE